ncbi:hypothetical protein CY35_04G087700 [Sphagnum magellanicum]|nr:hypothetical protein CY35_04G087700 [Sphagnum magellanicum]
MGGTGSCLHQPGSYLPSFVAVSGHEELRAKYRFRKVTGKDHTRLTREQFTDLLGPSPCTEGLFKYVDTDGDGTVSFNEIHKEITAFRSIKSPEAKLQVLYNFYDSDHDGKISRSEVADAMVVACGQALPKTQLEQLVNSTMEVFDTDKDGFLNFSEFSTLMWTSGLELR